MSRKAWIISGIVLLTLMLLAAAGAGGLFLMLHFRDQRRIRLAEEAFSAKDWRAARTYLSWHLAKHPDDVSSLLKYAEASANVLTNRRDALRDAGRAYFQIALKNPQDDEALRRVLRYSQDHQQWEQLEYSAAYFLRLRANDAMAPTLRYHRALALDRMGNQKEAIDNYSVLVDAGAETVDAYFNLARLLRQQGFAEQADVAVNQARQRFQDNPRLHFQSGSLYLEKRDLANAETEIKKALERAPDDPDILMAADQLAINQKNWDAAAIYAQKASAADPYRAEAYMSAVFLLDRNNETAKAIDLLAGLDPVIRADHPELFMTLAELQIASNRFDDAHDTIAAYQISYPDHMPIFEYLAARELLQKGRAAEAATKLAAVAESSPDFVRARFYQAVAHLQANQDDLAQGSLETYLRTRPNDERAQTLWNSKFAGARTPEEVESHAKETLANPDAGVNAFIESASSLLRTQNVKAGLSEANKTLIRQLLERAIQRDPASARPYMALAEFLLNQKDIEGTQTVLDRAEAEGIPAIKMSFLRAAVALSNGKADAARACMSEDFARPDITHWEIIHWANLWSSHDQLDVALEALEGAASRESQSGGGADRADLDAEQIAICLRSGALDRAEALIDSMASRLQNDPAGMKRLNDQKLAVAQVLLQDGGEDKAKKEKAEALLKSVEQADPANVTIRLFRARQALQQNPPDSTAAEVAARSVLETNPAQSDALLLLYGIAQGKGRVTEALDLAQRAATASSQNVSAQLAVAEANMRLQRFREARAALDRALAIRPDDTRALELLVRACGESGQAPEAKAAFARLEAVVGTDASKADRLNSLRGWVAAYDTNWAEAEKILRTQYQTKPDDFQTVQGLASAVAHQGRTGEAETVLKQFSEHNSTSTEAWTVLGQFYLAGLERPNLTGASSAFTRALFADPDYAPALRGMIDIQLRNNNVGTALSLCNRYLGNQPNDADVLRLKAALLAQNPARQGEALETIEHAIKIAERPEFFSVRGLLYLAQGKFTEAVADIQRFKDAQGRLSAELDAAMAEAYVGLQEYDLAKQFYESANAKAEKGETVNPGQLKKVKQQLDKAGEKKP